MFLQKFIGWNAELDKQKKFFDIMGTNGGSKLLTYPSKLLIYSENIS